VPETWKYMLQRCFISCFVSGVKIDLAHFEHLVDLLHTQLCTPLKFGLISV